MLVPRFRLKTGDLKSLISDPSACAQANVEGSEINDFKSPVFNRNLGTNMGLHHPVWPRTPSLLAIWHHSSATGLVLVTERSCRELELSGAGSSAQPWHRGAGTKL